MSVIIDIDKPERCGVCKLRNGVRCVLHEVFYDNWSEEYAHCPLHPASKEKHGRWIKDSDGLTVCSECGEVALQRVFVKLPEKIVDLQMRESHYCPNCGAKMDEEEERA